MARRLIILLVMSFCSLEISSRLYADEPTTKDVLRQLQGEWKAAKWVIHGEEVTEGRDNRSYRINNRTVTFVTEGKDVGTGTLKLDVDRRPYEIDVTYHGGPREGQTLLGIFKLEDGRFINCFSFPGEPRPTSFKSTEENRYFLSVDVRVEDKPSR